MHYLDFVLFALKTIFTSHSRMSWIILFCTLESCYFALDAIFDRLFSGLLRERLQAYLLLVDSWALATLFVVAIWYSPQVPDMRGISLLAGLFMLITSADCARRQLEDAPTTVANQERLDRFMATQKNH